MNKELIKELKAAGFPFDWCSITHEHSAICSPYDTPNLSELIKECGDELCTLQGDAGKWDAIYGNEISNMSHQRGDSPEEAVAKLWLELRRPRQIDKSTYDKLDKTLHSDIHAYEYIDEDGKSHLWPTKR